MGNSRLQEKWKNIGSAQRGRSLLEDQITRYLLITVAAVLLTGFIGVLIFNRIHLFTEYDITTSAEENDVDGTQYTLLGTHIIKYSHDGLFCTDFSNHTEWSHAYSMQTPISVRRGDVLAIAEQQGNLVYVVNEKGLLGNFETTLPIIRLEVSPRGMVALTLDDGDVTWVNLYQPDGTLIASVKTSMAVSGYPLDLAISDDAKRMMVSFAAVENGKVTGKLSFYDFSQEEEADEDHFAGTLSYEDMLFPEIYYNAQGRAIAIGDKGFITFSAARMPEEQKRVDLGEEIVNVFHDDSSVGFVFHSAEKGSRYVISAYNLGGRTLMTENIDYEFSDIRLENGEILLRNAGRIYAIRTSGKQKVAIEYEKEVNYFASLPGLRDYLVITPESMDRVKLK